MKGMLELAYLILKSTPCYLSPCQTQSPTSAPPTVNLFNLDSQSLLYLEFLKFALDSSPCPKIYFLLLALSVDWGLYFVASESSKTFCYLCLSPFLDLTHAIS